MISEDFQRVAKYFAIMIDFTLRLSIWAPDWDQNIWNVTKIEVHHNNLVSGQQTAVQAVMPNFQQKGHL